MVNLWGAAPLVAAAGAGTGTISYRQLPVFDYLGIPAMAGLFLTALALVASAVLVRRHDRRRNNEYQRIWGSLDRPILGSGAWTANDSWATNISTGFVVVGTFLAATASPTGMFPGIALDRFAFANLAAGFFVAAAPVLFGILYSWFTAQNPGLTADATVKLRGLRFATIAVPSGATVTIAADTAIHDDTSRWAVLRAGGAYQIPPGAKIRVVAGVSAAAQGCVTAADASIKAAAPHASATAIKAATESLRLAVERALAQAVAGPADPDDGPAADAIPGRVVAAINSGAVRTATTKAILAANARVADIVGALTGKTAARVADIVSDMDQAARQITVAQEQSPAMAYAGAADIGVLPGSVVVLSSCRGQWTVAEADVLRPVPPADTLFQHPVLIHATGGVKVTVTGAADVTLGEDAVISAPRRAPYRLPKTRRLLAPQGTNLIVANLGIILAVNVLTMFGIGAQLGIAGVLAAFSIATAAGKGWLFAALGVVGVLATWYAATATRALADPQPGSSISAQAGTSFTL
jgi:hypothetical protein